MVGEPQIFFRTSGCSATCSWCDTVYSKVRSPKFVIHETEKRVLPNPITPEAAIAEIARAHRQFPHAKTVSVTGGEPLEQAAFVHDVARGIRGLGLRVYLETNGIHPEELRLVADAVDVIAMDIKLPSAIGTVAWDKHDAFLRVADETGFSASHTGKMLFVKIVVDEKGSVDEVVAAAQMMAAVNDNYVLILQPESGALLSNRVPRPVAQTMMQTIAAAQRAAREFLVDVRILPQCHKILDVR